jgi:hypothetical protein
MGRTLHFDIQHDDGSKITEKEKQAMLDISLKYNNGRYKEAWTCENFFVDAYDYYPNWHHFEYDAYSNRSTDRSTEEIWDIVRKTEKKLTFEFGSRTKAIRKMAKDKIIAFHNEKGNQQVHGFCKVQGNEFNALLVYMALLDISKECKKLTISLSDEGRFLLCPIKIKNGKAQPILSEIKEDIQRHSARALLASKNNSKYSALDEIVIPEGMSPDLLHDMGIDNNYGEDYSIQYINEALVDLKEIQNAIRKHCDFFFVVYNIENHWFAPELFARKLNIEDFKDYKASPATLMGGFYGEYWNLTDKDAELESYKITGTVQKMLGDSGLKLEVLGG